MSKIQDKIYKQEEHLQGFKSQRVDRVIREDSGQITSARRQKVLSPKVSSKITKRKQTSSFNREQIMEKNAEDLIAEIKRKFECKINELNKKFLKICKIKQKKCKSLQSIEIEGLEALQSYKKRVKRERTLQYEIDGGQSENEQSVQINNEIQQVYPVRNQTKKISSKSKHPSTQLPLKEIQKIYSQCKQQEHLISEKLQEINLKYEQKQNQLSEGFKKIADAVQRVHGQVCGLLEQHKQREINECGIQEEIYGFVVGLKKMKKIYLRSQLNDYSNPYTRNGKKQLLKNYPINQMIDFISSDEMMKIKSMTQKGGYLIRVFQQIQQRLYGKYQKFSDLIERIQYFMSEVELNAQNIDEKKDNQNNEYKIPKKSDKKFIDEQVCRKEKLPEQQLISSLLIGSNSELVQGPLILSGQHKLQDLAKKLTGSIEFKLPELINSFMDGNQQQSIQNQEQSIQKDTQPNQCKKNVEEQGKIMDKKNNQIQILDNLEQIIEPIIKMQICSKQQNDETTLWSKKEGNQNIYERKESMLLQGYQNSEQDQIKPQYDQVNKQTQELITKFREYPLPNEVKIIQTQHQYSKLSKKLHSPDLAMDKKENERNLITYHQTSNLINDYNNRIESFGECLKEETFESSPISKFKAEKSQIKNFHGTNLNNQSQVIKGEASNKRKRQGNKFSQLLKNREYQFEITEKFQAFQQRQKQHEGQEKLMKKVSTKKLRDFQPIKISLKPYNSMKMLPSYQAFNQIYTSVSNQTQFTTTRTKRSPHNITPFTDTQSRLLDNHSQIFLETKTHSREKESQTVDKLSFFKNDKHILISNPAPSLNQLLSSRNIIKNNCYDTLRKQKLKFDKIKTCRFNSH